MANKVFISFRYSDGNDIKQDLVNKFWIYVNIPDMFYDNF